MAREQTGQADDLGRLRRAGEGSQQGVALRVVADRIAGGQFRRQLVRVGVDRTTDDEERGRDVEPLQDAQDPRRVGARPIVKGQGDLAPAVAGQLHIGRVAEDVVDGPRPGSRRHAERRTGGAGRGLAGTAVARRAPRRLVGSTAGARAAATGRSVPGG